MSAGPFSLDMQIAELQAELKLRREAYPRIVSRGHMRVSEAGLKIACLDAALATLIRVRDGQTPAVAS